MGNCCSCKTTADEQPTPLPPSPVTPVTCPSVIFHEDWDHCHPCHCDQNSNSEMVTTTIASTTSAQETTQFCLNLVTPDGSHASKLRN